MNNKPHRDTIFSEQGKILSHEHLDGDQHILRVAAPECAANAQPGQFSHIQVHPQRPLRRPISIMRVSPDDGWVDFLYKAIGEGTALLAERETGETLELLGPIGIPFEVTRKRPLLIGGGVGMPPMIFLAESIKQHIKGSHIKGSEPFFQANHSDTPPSTKEKRALTPLYQPFVIMGSEVPFPFPARPSQILMPELPDGVIATMPLLDDWNIPCRLASLQGYAGCHQGYVTDLARLWLEALDDDARAEVEIFSCGPHPMLEAVAALAKEFDIPCQVSLEEFMACGIGGCAGCVVPVTNDQGVAMKRVCVDGPVFDAKTIFAA